MSIRKPVPLCATAEPALCPICGKVSYSAGGIHPQCAVQRAATLLDAGSLERRVRERKTAASKRPWSKSCPKCRKEVAARRAVCDCGHSFLVVKSGQHD